MTRISVNIAIKSTEHFKDIKSLEFFHLHFSLGLFHFSENVNIYILIYEENLLFGALDIYVFPCAQATSELIIKTKHKSILGEI